LCQLLNWISRRFEATCDSALVRESEPSHTGPSRTLELTSRPILKIIRVKIVVFFLLYPQN
jgi:hypothetical protein